MRLTTRHAANLGVLAAVSIVLTRVFGFVIGPGGILRISLGEIPIILAGVLFGPVGGGLTGIAADIIGVAINSHGGVPHPGFTLSAALTGFIPGLLLHKHRDSLKIWQIGLVVLLTDLVAGLFLNTLWLTMLLKQNFFVILSPRLLSRPITLPLYTLVVFWLNRAYQSYRRGTSY